jgi:hypothetical protein
MTKIFISWDQNWWAGSPSLGLAAGKWASVMNDSADTSPVNMPTPTSRPGRGVGWGRGGPPFLPTPLTCRTRARRQRVAYCAPSPPNWHPDEQFHSPTDGRNKNRPGSTPCPKGHDAAAARAAQPAHHYTGRFPQAPDRPGISAMPPSFSFHPRVIITRAWHACMHGMHACMARTPSIHESLLRVHGMHACMHGAHTRTHDTCSALRSAAFRGASSPDNVRQHVTADSRAVVAVAVVRSRETRGPPTTCLLPNLIRPALCLRASANAISRGFADTIDGVVSPSAGILRRYYTPPVFYASLSYPTIV